jgi:hypothetical protein
MGSAPAAPFIRLRRSTSVKTIRARSRGPVGHRDQDAVRRVQGIARERLEIALRVEHEDPVPRRVLQNPAQRERILGPGLEQTHVWRRGYEVDAVFADPQDAIEAALGPAVLQVAFPGARRTQGEHAIDHALVVEADQRHREVLAQGAQVDRQVRCEARLAHTPLVRGDGQDGAYARRREPGGGLGHGENCTHPVGWRP